MASLELCIVEERLHDERKSCGVIPYIKQHGTTIKSQMTTATSLYRQSMSAFKNCPALCYTSYPIILIMILFIIPIIANVCQWLVLIWVTSPGPGVKIASYVRNWVA